MSEPDERDAEAESPPPESAPPESAPPESAPPHPGQRAGEGDEPDPQAAPPAKKKKNKKSAPREDAAPAKLPGEGTPEGAKLVEANEAFASGNYARVRELATELQKAKDPQVADAASALVRKVSADPVQLAFIGLCAFAILVITWIYVIEPASH